MWRIDVPETAWAAHGDGEHRSFWNHAFAGFRTVAKEPAPRLLVGMFGLQTLVAGTFIVLEVVIALDLLHKGDGWVGVIGAAFGVGGILGAVVAAALVGKGRLAVNFGVGILLWGGPLMLVALWPSAAVVLLAMALMGLGNTVVDVSGMTLLQRAVPDEVLARVFGVLETTFLATVALGAGLAPVIVRVAGARGALMGVGAFLPICILLAWRSLLRLDRSVRAPEAELALLRGIAFFSPLAPQVLEHLARRTKTTTVPAGSHVFEQGDRGDRFYVVAEGGIDIAIDGRVVTQIAAGGYFGEIALLHDVPRQAAAAASLETRLLSLEGGDFVAAVTGHATSAEAAEAVIRSYGPNAGLNL